LETEDQTLGFTKSQVARSRGGDPDHWIQATGEPLDQNLRMVSHIGGLGLKEFIFYCRSRKVLSVEGLYEHVAHPLGGDRMVDRWHNNNAQRKVEASDRWWTHVDLGRGQTIVDLSRFADSQGRSRGNQHFNSRSCELRGALESCPSRRSLVEALSRREPYSYRHLGYRRFEKEDSRVFDLLASEFTPGLQQEQSPTPISLMSRFVYKMDDQMDVNSGQHRFKSKTRLGTHGKVRS
jgi:hypothetical protein